MGPVYTLAKSKISISPTFNKIMSVYFPYHHHNDILRVQTLVGRSETLQQIVLISTIDCQVLSGMFFMSLPSLTALDWQVYPVHCCSLSSVVALGG